MARLNDLAQQGQNQQQQQTMYPAETVEALRRKMLRQNRELARANSTQAIRLRQLESECARMLSENLELRSVILRMEKEAEDNQSDRIADQAIEIKRKLETQLAEFGDLIASLGSEPPAKRQSLESRKVATPKSASRRRSSYQRPLRDMAKELEARAREEGRLMPIMENNTYPRASEEPEEVPVSPNDGYDMTTSPALGTPPSSRFIEEDTILETPTRGPIRQTKPKNKLQVPDLQPSSPSKTTVRSPILSPIRVTVAQPMNLVIEHPPVLPAKTGKRKHYIEVAEGSRSSDSERETSIVRASSIREKTKGKNLKELAALRREAQERQTESSGSETSTSTTSSTRRPLAAKSTNKDLSTTRRASKDNMKADKVILEKENDTEAAHDHTHIKSREQPIHIVEPVSVPPKRPDTIRILANNQDSTASRQISGPKSPEPTQIEEVPRLGDTPPPAHISSSGETSRPSRRSRASVSYAEPNLRDKMRRPTKELFDAVAGEGKYMRRSSTKHDILLQPEAPITKPQNLASEAPIKSKPVTPGPTAVAYQADISTVSESTVSSSTKEEEELILPTDSFVTERRKRKSAAWDAPVLPSVINSVEKPSAPQEAKGGNVDLYEFTVTSPAASGKRSNAHRRASAADPDWIDASEKPARSSRKRATMSAAPKRSRADMEAPMTDEAESTTDDTISAPRAKAHMRRKSTLT